MSANVMAEEGFLHRWSRLKSTPEAVDEPVDEPPPAAAPLATVQDDERPPPTLDDVALLTPESDYSAFVAKGVDKAVQRMALKKLFADPNFAVMDGLDIYIADYNKAAPLTDAMLASLKHAPGVLNRLLGEDEDDDDPPAEGEGTPTQGTP
jgi:hypothetical protein